MGPVPDALFRSFLLTLFKTHFKVSIRLGFGVYVLPSGESRAAIASGKSRPA